MAESSISDILLSEESPPDWLVPELFIQGGVYCLIGEAGTGKSAISYTLSLAIGAGLPMFGGMFHCMEPKRVLYFDEENSEQDRNAYIRRAWGGLVKQWKIGQSEQWRLIGLMDQNIRLVHFEMGTDEWVETATRHISEHPPHVMFFDTATPVFNIAEENDNGVASKVVRKLRELMKLSDPIATAIVLKHAKHRSQKGGQRTVRGGKAWEGAVDGFLHQVKAPGRPRSDGLRLTRLEPGKVRAFGLRSTVYITPRYTDDDRSGLILDASFTRDREHKKAEEDEEKGLDD